MEKSACRELHNRGRPVFHDIQIIHKMSGTPRLVARRAIETHKNREKQARRGSMSAQGLRPAKMLQ